MLATKSLKYQYPGQAAMEFPDIQCQQGEHWLLIGPSGSGKTTLLHLLGGLLTSPLGEVRVKETALNTLSGSALDQFRGREIGIIFQKAHFVRALNVEENLLLAQKLAGAKLDKERVKTLLERLNIGHKLKARPDRLSQGEQQRVAIARALVNQPAIILADEPTSALDDQNAREVIQLLEEQAMAVNATLLVVTHDARLKDHIANQIEL
ncbi:MAG: ATP-binding cassette domain-containing protein [Bacteroidota bacterium]